MGDPEYFVCDLDCSHSLHPFLDGKPTNPLITQQTIDDAFSTNPYRAAREYLNRFDADGGEDVFVKRSVINRFSTPMVPEFKNPGNKRYIISYERMIVGIHHPVGVVVYASQYYHAGNCSNDRI